MKNHYRLNIKHIICGQYHGKIYLGDKLVYECPFTDANTEKILAHLEIQVNKLKKGELIVQKSV